MPLTFPASPSVGGTYTVGARTWTWSGTIWEITGTVAAAGSIGTTELAASAVTQAKLAAGLSGITVTTTANRSAVIPSPFNGQFIFLTDTTSLQRWDGSAWVVAIPTIPTGAPTSLAVSGSPTISTVTLTFTPGDTGGSDIVNYQYALSTNSGSTYGSYTALATPDATSPITITGLALGTTYYVKLKAVNNVGAAISESAAISFTTAGLSVEHLVVAGGGGGGAGHAGGGGAGGYRTGTVSRNVGTYTVTVGGGGSGGIYQGSTMTNGANSVFGSITSTGGGYGGAQNSPGIVAPATGGSGGGGAYTTNGIYNGAAGNAGGFTPPEGYAGGTPPGSTWFGAGGGGSGGVGGSLNGGVGTANSITGTSVTYAAGGNGQANTNTNVAGGANTGTGGGGARDSHGSAGGSGIVIVRYLTADAATATITGGTATTSGSYTVRTFLASGSLVIA